MQEDAALALAEHSADPTIREVIGQTSIPALLEILEDASAEDSQLMAAAMSLGVLCRDSPANRCLLVEDEKRERAGPPRLVHKYGPPALAGLRKLMALESETLQSAAAEVLMSVENVFYVKQELEFMYDFMIQRRSSQLRSVSEQVAAYAKSTVVRICVKEMKVTSWSDVLPHILVKQLMVDNTKKIQEWGAALVVNKAEDSATAMAVRLACLLPLLDVLFCGAHEQERGALVLQQLANYDCIKTQALRMGFLLALLGCLAVASKKHRAMKEAVADAVVALMVGDVEPRGAEAEEAILARTEALPLIEEVLRVTQVEDVKEKLTAVVARHSIVAEQ